MQTPERISHTWLIKGNEKKILYITIDVAGAQNLHMGWVFPRMQ